MSDHLADTPSMTAPWCPGCEPRRDPMTEMLDTRWCDTHQPTREGAMDDVVNQYAYLMGSAEAGGEDNRRWCATLHRSRA